MRSAPHRSTWARHPRSKLLRPNLLYQSLPSPSLVFLAAWLQKLDVTGVSSCTFIGTFTLALAALVLLAVHNRKRHNRRNAYASLPNNGEKPPQLPPTQRRKSFLRVARGSICLCFVAVLATSMIYHCQVSPPPPPSSLTSPCP